MRPTLAPSLLFTILACLAFSATSAGAADPRPTIRETVGTVEVRGWQKELVKGNPNLQHWHWNPIYSNVQGYKKVGPGGPPMRQQGIYRPIKGGDSPKRYIKPKHVAFDLNQPKKPSKPYIDIPALRNSDVSGNLTSNEGSGTLSSKDASGMLAARDINGELINKEVNGKAAPYSNYKSKPDSFEKGSSADYAQSSEANVYGKVKTPNPKTYNELKAKRGRF